MLVSIVYVNYRTAELLRDSVRSVIENCVGVKYEIVVVDNASNDNIEEILKEFTDVRLVKLEQNIGFGCGNNAALEYCNGDFVFFLNTDTVLLNDAVTILANSLKYNDNWGQVGANLYHKNGEPNQSFLYLHSWLIEVRAEMPKCLKLGYYKPKKWFNFTETPKKVGYISGAATMLRREWIEKFGGFDEDFFIYFEDMELSVRVRKSGGDVVNVPQAKICHLGGGSSGGGCAGEEAFVRRHEMLCQSKYTFYRKTQGKAYATLVFITLQAIYFGYATFAGSKKRKLYKQLIINNLNGYNK